MGGPKQGFLYHAAFHTLLAPSQQRTAEKKILHPHLRDEAKAYLSDLALMHAEETKVTHGLHFLFSHSKTEQGMRDVLPEVVVRFYPPWAPLPRQMPPGWPFAGQSLQQLQVQEIFELLEFYISNRIL